MFVFLKLGLGKCHCVPRMVLVISLSLKFTFFLYVNRLNLRGHLWSKWGIKEKELLAPPTSHTVSPQNVPVGMNEKSQKCVHARHGLRACWNRVRIAAEAGWGTRKLLPRTCFYLYPQVPEKAAG